MPSTRTLITCFALALVEAAQARAAE